MNNIRSLIHDLKPGTVAVIGVPTDENSSFMSGAALAPARIREVLHSVSTNMSTESGLDLDTDPGWRDLGDLKLPTGFAVLERIEASVSELLSRDLRVLSLGGDHAITYPIIRAYSAKYRVLNILHLDAHPDLYDEFKGNRFSHACPFARIMEESLVAHLVQVGIRAMNPHQRAQAERFGVEVFYQHKWHSGIPLDFQGPLYLSLDMDVLDPAFAPGVSHHEPGGFSTRDLLQLIQGLRAPVVGADIVEYNPKRDLVDTTAMTAAKLLKEVVACMIAGGSTEVAP